MKTLIFLRRKKKNILHCIEAHRKRSSCIPITIEAKVLFDADKIDSLGAVGVGRLFHFSGNIHSKFYSGKEKELIKSGRDFNYSKEDSAFLEYEFKIKYIKDRLLTVTGRKIAKKRSEFMKNFFETFWEEIEGEK